MSFILSEGAGTSKQIYDSLNENWLLGLGESLSQSEEVSLQVHSYITCVCASTEQAIL